MGPIRLGGGRYDSNSYAQPHKYALKKIYYNMYIYLHFYDETNTDPIFVKKKEGIYQSFDYLALRRINTDISV